MKRFDYQILLSNRENKLKKYICLFSIFAFIYIATFFSGVFFSTFENKTTIMVVFSFVLSLLTILLVTFYVFGISANKKSMKVIIDILNSYLITAKGKIIKINDQVTTIKNRKIREITICENKENYIFYFDNEFGNLELRVGDYIEVKTSSSFLISYEVLNEKISK